MIVGIILAAGESKRMGQPKALLKIGPRTFLDHIASTLIASKIDMVYAVVGDNAELICQEIDKNIQCIHNPAYRDGQLTSLKAAIERIHYENCDGALVTLVDHPLISSRVVEQIVENFYLGKKRIVVPTYEGKRGHPVLYSREIFSDILAAPLDQGANALRQSHLEHTLELPVDDPGILVDIDTPKDYERHIQSSAARTW